MTIGGAPLDAPSAPPEPSRDEASDKAQASTATSRPAARGIEPRPQKLPRTRAVAIAEAAELTRDPDDRSQWLLRSGDTVLGVIVPSYGGTSRSGRTGWTGRIGGGPPTARHKTRREAATDLTASWIRLVTATPRRTLTGE